MARFIPKQFAENSTTSVVFGSFQEQGGNVGDGTISSDPATLQGGTAWPLGWSAATDNFFKIPRGEEMEGLERVLSAAIVQQFKDGLTFWQSEMPVTQYQTIVQYQTGSDLPKLYINITGSSTSTPPDSDTTNWKEMSLGGGGEIGDMGFAPLGIDESLNLRRYLNGQVISQTQFVAFTTKVKSAVALFPSLATDEATWQAEKLLSKFGQVGKFVIDDDAGTIRLPAVVNAQGLLGLSGIGNLVNESLPNITGGIGFYSTGKEFGSFYATDYNSRDLQTAGDNARGVGFDASRSSSAYQDNAPVQQEAVQYPYYIQVATGVEETLPAIREYKTNVPYVLGDSRYFEANPYNASWLVSNGQYNSSSVYPDFWTQLTGVELNGSLNVGDTIDIGGKTYVKRGLPVVLSTGTITDYDFVVNQNDQTFRLPLKTKLASGSAVVGNGVGLGVVNSAGVERTLEWGTQNDSSEWTIPVTGANNFTYVNVGTQVTLTQDPTKSGIETSSNGLKLYYYVGDTVQDASLINAGAVLGQLSDKISRTATSDKELVVGWGMPDYSAGVSKALNTSITATRNCFVAVLSANSTNTAGLYVNDAKIGSGGNLYSTSYIYLTAYVAKGQTYRTENIATYGSWVGSVTEFPLIGG